jgi:hypothetical protein
MITRRLAVTNIWRRYAVPAFDIFGIADLPVGPKAQLAADSFAIAETLAVRRQPVETFSISDSAHH